ncbi:MAG: alpha/beta hydrolase [Solirubrobacteraceae bacterium]
MSAAPAPIELEAGGRTIGGLQLGAGPPLVLLNGLAATHADWDPAFVAALAESWTVVALDHRGMGASSDDGAPFTIEDLAADVATATDGLGLGPAAVAGWSMGGFVALALAAARPGLVTSLALLGTATGGGEPSPPGVLETITDLEPPPREQAARLLALLFPAPVAAQIDAEFGDLVADARAGLDAGVLARQRQAILAWQAGGLAGRLGEIRAPALVACGTADAVIPPANALTLAAGLDGSWLVRFRDAGHAFMAQVPAAIASLVTLHAAAAPN